MSKLSDVCQIICSDVDGALAVGVVDLSSGMMMAVHHTVPYFTQDYLDAVAAASVDMFRGRLVSRIEQLLSKQRGSEIKGTFQEMFINSTNVFHFMKVIEGKEAVVIMVTKKTTNQGMGWSSLKLALADIKALLP